MRTNFDFDGCNTPHKIWDRDQTNVKRLSKLDCPDMSLMKNVLTHHEKENQAMMTVERLSCIRQDVANISLAKLQQFVSLTPK